MNLRKCLTAGLLAAAITTCGCASMIYTSNYDNYVTQEVSTYLYSGSQITNAMTAARSILFEQGYRIIPNQYPYQFETEWGNTGNYLRRYMVTVYEQNDGSASIQFHYVESTTPQPGAQISTSTARDYTMEAEVIRRIAPSDWSRISAEAKAYADNIAAQSK